MSEQYTTPLNLKKKKKKTAQGDIMHVTAQNPATVVVAGNSRSGIWRVKTYFSTHLPKKT
jgi:16S rRNA G1207 methylase RsmC